jgi:hypothetical protein
MPGAIYAEVLKLFENAYYPNSTAPTLVNAWLGIYEVLLTYEYGVPQVFDKDDLKQGSWKRRAEAFEQYLAQNFGIPQPKVAGLVGQMMQHPRWMGKQINNPRGHGFRTIVAHLMRTSGASCVFQEEAHAKEWFPGIRLPGASKDPRVDILVICGDQARAVISCKWTVRHDRVSDITNECPVYKAAANRLRYKPFDHFVVTNESSPARLAKMLDDDCLDGVVHVHKDALRVMEINGRTTKVIDLVDFIKLVATW